MIAALETRLARIGVTYFAPLRRHLLSFWRWWSKELGALLPASMQRAIAASNEQLFAQVSGTNLVVFQGSIERMQELAQFPLDARDSALPDIHAGTRQVVLLLPPERLLDTTVTLPAATEENLREVLAFEMDQLTPFTVDQVYYGFERSTNCCPHSNVSVCGQVLCLPKQAAHNCTTLTCYRKLLRKRHAPRLNG
jgi:general secretion pathway protein L